LTAAAVGYKIDIDRGDSERESFDSKDETRPRSDQTGNDG